MSNKKKVKIAINSEVLCTLIKNETSIRKLGPAIGYSEKTIRRGLKDKEMSPELVFILAKGLRIDPNKFAKIDEYFARLEASD